MNRDFSKMLPNFKYLEYIDETHTYLIDGIEVPSITQILQKRFSKKYDGVDPETLERAAAKGTQLHDDIEALCKGEEVNDSQEVRDFRFLKRIYNFDVLENEVPVILERNGEPVAAGRLDLVIQEEGKLGLADIKRTYNLDIDYVGYQLNLYRLAYQQTYEAKIDILRAIWLREGKRQYRRILVNEELAWEAVEQFYRKENNEN